MTRTDDLGIACLIDSLRLLRTVERVAREFRRFRRALRLLKYDVAEKKSRWRNRKHPRLKTTGGAA